MLSKENRQRLEELSGWLLPPDAEVCSFLLRKLFEHGYVWVKGVTEVSSIDGTPFWKAGWNVIGHHVEAEGADTPEDALCLLCIRLLESGILEPHEKKDN